MSHFFFPTIVVIYVDSLTLFYRSDILSFNFFFGFCFMRVVLNVLWAGWKGVVAQQQQGQARNYQNQQAQNPPPFQAMSM